MFLLALPVCMRVRSLAVLGRRQLYKMHAFSAMWWQHARSTNEGVVWRQKTARDAALRSTRLRLHAALRTVARSDRHSIKT